MGAEAINQGKGKRKKNIVQGIALPRLLQSRSQFSHMKKKKKTWVELVVRKEDGDEEEEEEEKEG